MNIGGPVISQAMHRCRFKKTHSREEEVWRGSIPCNGIIVSIDPRICYKKYTITFDRAGDTRLSGQDFGAFG